MDTSERLVEAYLRHCGYADIQYEPDGNIPPDFLVDRRLAIEVRRLNQNHDDGTTVHGLEEVAFNLGSKVEGALTSLGPPTNGQSWFVFYRFSRPVPDWKVLRPRVEHTLKVF